MTAHKALVGQGVNDIGTCELLAYVALKNGNQFNSKRDIQTLNKLMAELKSGNRASIDKYADNKYFKYYANGYHAVLDGIINPKTGELTGYHPIAAGYWFSCYDDFGTRRGYGYKRRHLGHDLFGGTGTPIIAVEGGTITELGWNQYGGWRIGIRSDDTKRYYYYAHLRKDKPYPAEFKIGDRITAGQVVGYLGNTGYSRRENTNMKTNKPHLHFGMQIIFDKSQEDGPGEIWVDVYEICKLLSKNRTKTVKGPDGERHAAGQ
jgi:murein DD-endopeptidase MepM/ murein hydrolase activator NlpD